MLFLHLALHLSPQCVEKTRFFISEALALTLLSHNRRQFWKEAHSMQHIQSLEPCFKSHQSVSLFERMTTWPSLWGWVETQVEETLKEEKKAELIFGVVTVLLTVGVLASLAHAMAHYQIVPWP